MTNLRSFLFLLIVIIGCNNDRQVYMYETDTLLIEQISDHAYRHVTYLQTDNFGKVACNGMIVIDDDEAAIIDTPSGIDESNELITWVRSQLGSRIVGVVVTHFHIDCLGGIEAFHAAGIPSYGNISTVDLATAAGNAPPERGFTESLTLQVGNTVLENVFLGEGHTKDNIVSYFPKDQVLFGGCLIKELDASKGNLADANVAAWTSTVNKVKESFPNTKIVIPGHGKSGGLELLTFTSKLFAE